MFFLFFIHFRQFKQLPFLPLLFSHKYCFQNTHSKSAHRDLTPCRFVICYLIQFPISYAFFSALCPLIVPDSFTPPANTLPESNYPEYKTTEMPALAEVDMNKSLDEAEYEKKRTENLLKENAATQKQIDDIDSQIAVLQKQLEAQISTLQRGNASVTEESSAYEIQVAQLEDQLNKCRISSPINGTVLAKYAETGELAISGKPLFKVADIQNMFLRAYITADQLSQLKLGDKVKVFSDLGDDDRREYEGVITWISDKSEFTPKTIQTRDERANLVYAIKIAVKNDGYLKIGMYGEIKKE